MLSIMLLASLAAADMLPTGRAVVRIEGMTCMSCETKVRNAFATVEGLGVVTASLTEGAACVEVTAPTPSEDVEAAMVSISYRALSVESVDLCPPALSPGAPKRVWANTAGVDVAIISRGEAVNLASHRADGKFTVYDFGADWCGPCRAIAPHVEAIAEKYEGFTSNTSPCSGFVTVDDEGCAACWRPSPGRWRCALRRAWHTRPPTAPSRATRGCG